MAKGFDLNRGVLITRHASGMYVGMYFDAPGQYVSELGTEVPEKLAREAGIDTERYAKERLRRERMAQAADIINAELDGGALDEAEIVREASGLRLTRLPGGNMRVTDAEGNALHPLPLAPSTAESLFAQLVGEDAQDTSKKGDRPAASVSTKPATK